MQLNHLSMAVPDVVAAAEFFEHYFDFKPAEIKGNNRIAVMTGTDGFVLVLSNLRGEEAPGYPQEFHFGFLLTDMEQVNVLYNRLQTSEAKLDMAPRKIRDSWGFYFHMPGGIMGEVSCPLPAPVVN